MKFLITASGKEAFYQNTSSVIRQIIVAHRDIINQQKEEGKVLDAYMAMGAGSSVIICDFNNSKEMFESINEMPARPYEREP